MDHPQERARLGTFAGIFTPSVLAILWIILFFYGWDIRLMRFEIDGVSSH